MDEAPVMDDAPVELTYEALEPAGSPAPAEPALDRLRDVPVELSVEIGRARMTLGQALALGPGAIVALDRLAGEPVDLLVNGRRIARGEVVVVDDEFGVRLTEVVAPGEATEVAQTATAAE
jgi:flagellar motor switch protein FliN/FliY